MFYKYKDFVPVVHKSAFVHPQAVVTGNVTIGKDVYIGPFAAIRGDFGGIVISDGCNVQESCTIHMFPGVTVTLGENAHIGHGAIVHGAQVGRDTLIGMHAVLMDDAQIGDECIVGALCFVKAGQIIPNRSIAVGNPARIVKEVTDKMLAWKQEGTELYQQLARDCHDQLEPCEPIDSESHKLRTTIESTYIPWNKRKEE